MLNFTPTSNNSEIGVYVPQKWPSYGILCKTSHEDLQCLFEAVFVMVYVY
jgi:hypothetical protein